MATPDSPAPRLIVALDSADAAAALALAARLDPRRCAVKVGKELFVAAGPQVVREIVARGFNVFLDLKFHDIPNTVAGACAAAARLGAWMIDVHAAGGRAMLAAARNAIDDDARTTGRSPPLLVAVTVLTSLDAAALAETGVAEPPVRQALRLARLARECGLDGAVCSAQEAPELRAAFGASFTLVTPGIRPAGAPSADQARVVTPADAVARGADYLVIGRPITAAPDPLAALAAIDASLGDSR
ncbi:MAG: orotidine-5'-phosphate decarboxylase [Proteobacteria bacterium]|jgi:orotidine-5'-phosphate decarboxylase|nr:orotidine-5'-phosphate decarboxylase [Pseudomonadota bacterium]